MEIVTNLSGTKVYVIDRGLVIAESNNLKNMYTILEHMGGRTESNERAIEFYRLADHIFQLTNILEDR